MSNDGNDNYNQQFYDQLKFKQYSNNNKQNIYQMPIPMISQSHINGPMQKRIQTINEEMQKQKQNLPQFKNLNSKVNQMNNCLINAPASNYGQQNIKVQYKGMNQNNNQSFTKVNKSKINMNKGSIAALRDNGESIQYVRDNSQEEHGSYQRPNPVSRGAVSTNDQSFYMNTHASPRNNFRENLHLLQQQQLLQMNLLERAQFQQSQSFTIKKKKLQKPIPDDSQTNYKHNPSNIILYEGTDQFMNDINNQSAIGILRNAAMAKPELDTFSHDYQIQKYAHNFKNHLKVQKNNFGQGQIGTNIQSQPKIGDMRTQKSPALKKKRRLINAQYDGVYSQFDYQLDTQNIAYQMTKSATDFNKNILRLQALQQGNPFYQGASNITTPILKKGINDNTIVLSEQMDNLQTQNLIDENNQMKTTDRAITQMVYSTEDLRKIQNNQFINNKNLIKNYVRIQEEEYAKRTGNNMRKKNNQNVNSLPQSYTFDMNSSGVDNTFIYSDQQTQDKYISDKKSKISKYHQDSNKQEGAPSLSQTPVALQYQNEIKAGAKYIDYINGVPIEAYIHKDAYTKGVMSPQLKQAKNQITMGQKLPSIQKSMKNQRFQQVQDKRLSSGMQNKQNKFVNEQKLNTSNDLSTRKLLKGRKYDSISKKDLSSQKKITNIQNYSTQKKSNQIINEIRIKRSNNDIKNEEEDKINNIEIPNINQKEKKVSIQEQQSGRRTTSRNEALQSSDRQIIQDQQLKFQHSFSPKRIKKFNVISNQDVLKSRSISQKKSGIKNSKRHSHSKEKRSNSNKKYSARRHPKNNLYKYDPKFFNKINPDPPLFQVDVDQEDYYHLMNDDLDEVSKLEVTYKILKEQLREHQKKLIEAREEKKRKKLQQKMINKRRSTSAKPIDLNRFARHIKHFELYGSQRDLSPELKRIVKNLMCQEHKFMYCPCCKTYDLEEDFDPIENIQKFMDYIKLEQQKLRKKKKVAIETRKQKKKNKVKLLPDDSASDITYLEEQEILAKYTDENMTLAQRKWKERLETQKRLYGESTIKGHNCSPQQRRPKSARQTKTVRMELREIEDPKSMYDESNSAHQFSKRNMSIQADSEARLDAQMQTSAIDYKSMVNQTSKQDANSVINQTSDIDQRSNQMQTSLFGPNAPYNHSAVQTDPKYTRRKTPIRKSKQNQTEKLKDMYKADWIKSSVYKKAMKNEAIKRNISFERLQISEDDEESEKEGEDTAGMFVEKEQEQKQEAINTNSQNTDDDQEDQNEMQNAQDPDAIGVPKYQNGIGFLKNYKVKGNIKLLTESELQYVKKLLKQKNHELWNDPSNLNDLHRHCKYTIRKLTQKMANIDNYQVFKHLKNPTREHTLYLVYRAERLFSALTETEKIFQLVSQTILDDNKFEQIIQNKSIKKDDQKFIKQRELIFRRIMTQINTFNETYKIFTEFNFKVQPLREYLTTQLEKVTQCKLGMDEIRQANPELAAKEDEKLKEEERDKQQKKVAMRNYLKELENQVNLPEHTNEDGLNTSRDEVLLTSNQLQQSESKQLISDSNQKYHIQDIKKSIQTQNNLNESLKISQPSKAGIQVNKSQMVQDSLQMRYDQKSQKIQESLRQGSIIYQSRNQLVQKSFEVEQIQELLNVEKENKVELTLEINKYNEQDIVGNKTIEIINQQVKDEQNIIQKNSDALKKDLIQDYQKISFEKLYEIPKEDFKLKETPKLQTIQLNQNLKNENRKPNRRLSALTNSTIAAGENVQKSQNSTIQLQNQIQVQQKTYIGYSEEKRLKLVTGNVKIELENNHIDDQSSQIQTPRLNGKQVKETKIDEDIYSD